MLWLDAGDVQGEAEAKKETVVAVRNLAEGPNDKNHCDRQGACPLQT